MTREQEEQQLSDYHYFGSLWDETIKDEENEYTSENTCDNGRSVVCAERR